ncbi:hypothetical protein QUA58_13805 [Microcoleus sp. N9_A1]
MPKVPPNIAPVEAQLTLTAASIVLEPNPKASIKIEADAITIATHLHRALPMAEIIAIERVPANNPAKAPAIASEPFPANATAKVPAPEKATAIPIAVVPATAKVPAPKPKAVPKPFSIAINDKLASITKTKIPGKIVKSLIMVFLNKYAVQTPVNDHINPASPDKKSEGSKSPTNQRFCSPVLAPVKFAPINIALVKFAP